MTILWSITNKDGSPFPLAGKKVHLYYTCERGRYEAEIEIQNDNVIAWSFLGSDQKTLGDYTLTVEILQSDGKRAIRKDVCNAFTLVGKNCEEKYDLGEAYINEGGRLTLTTELDIYRISPIIPYVVKDENGIGYWYVDGVNTGDRSTGESAYDYAKSKGYEGTEEEFAERLAGFPDWNATSQDEVGYIKNRTHGITTEYVSVEGTLSELGFKRGEYVSVLNFPRLNGRLEGEELYLNGFVYAPVVGEEYQVKYAGPSVYARMVAVENGFDVQIKGNIDTGDVVKIAFVEIRRIDDTYISSNIARKSQVDALDDKKVNKEKGKGLSTNDYTDEDKKKLADIEVATQAEIDALFDEGTEGGDPGSGDWYGSY